MQDTYRTSIGHISHYQQAPLKKVDTSAGELHIYISPFKSYLIVMSSSFKYKKQKMQSRNRRVHTSFLTVYLQRNCSSETCELRQPNGSDGLVHQLFRGTLDLDIIRRDVVGVGVLHQSNYKFLCNSRDHLGRFIPPF